MTESEAVQAAIGKAGEEARNQRRKISRLEETNLRLRT